VTSLSPNNGSSLGGFQIFINGTAFTGATAVKFGSTAATSFNVGVDGTFITAVAPAGTGTVDVTVTTPAGTSAINAASKFTYSTAASAPTVTSISPTTGIASGGTFVTITGTNFTGATAVKFGAALAPSSTVISATQITAIAPSGVGGSTVDVTVTTPTGTSATSAADQFSYVGPPTITSISPNSGAPGGSTTVTIIGTNFESSIDPVQKVRFGSIDAPSFVRNSATQITAISPAGAGTVDVTVFTNGGVISATSAADRFTYSGTVPLITSISPNSGPIAGGANVTITGVNFTGATAVRFGSTNAALFTVNSAASITATSPAGSAGAVDITVTTPAGTSPTNAADQFTYGAATSAPTVTSISPTTGIASGGTFVTITGTNFTGATAVKFGAALAPSSTVISATQITAIAPSGVGGSTVDVTVTTPTGTSATSAADQFSYVGPPTITSISPNSGAPGGGTTVTIIGTNFESSIDPVQKVRFGSIDAPSFIRNSATQITAISPAGAGIVDVTVFTNGGVISATSAADRFTYSGTVPSVTSVSPNSGPVTGGTSVTISGANFTGAAVVRFGGTAATLFTVSSATSITAISPAGNASTVDITVTTPGGTSATSATDQFNYSMIVATVAVTSSLNPSMSGQSVTFTATVSTSAGVPTGNVTFKDGATVLGTGTLSSGTAALSTAALAIGTHSITATYSGDSNFAASISPVLVQTISQTATTTTITSSLNPSEIGKSVTFTASVSSASGVPTGIVAFKDGAGVLGTATLSGGMAALSTSSLTLGSHNITANYVGVANFAASVSGTLIQAVNTPADSLKLRALQVLVTPVVGQVSGQAVSSAVDSAISEAFSGSGALVTPNSNGVRFNFAGDPDGDITASTPRASDPFSSATGSFGSGRGLGSPLLRTASVSHVDDTFGALPHAGPTTTPPPSVTEPKDWFGWAEVRGATLDHWGSLTATPAAAMLYGSQVNLLAGLSRKLTPNFLIGVLGGYETFDYRSDALLGRLKGDGWTVGSYVGWMITTGIRFDAAVAYSGIGYDGSAGTASGSFAGNRRLVASGLTGTYQTYGIRVEPSARVYALWEHENAYTDTLGTLQTARDFATGRASGGVKLSYPVAWSATISFAPYFGVYGDYYFNSDSAGAPAAAAIPFIVLDGWSARAVGGLTATFDNGAQLAVGGERSGIGGNFSLWTYRARASVPFGAR
jgi:hypothetical protein